MSATPDQILQALADLRAEFAAFQAKFAGVLAPSKRIEPDAIYSIPQAAGLVPLSRFTLRKYCRLGLIRARGPHWQIRGSELLKLGGKT